MSFVPRPASSHLIPILFSPNVNSQSSSISICLIKTFVADNKGLILAMYRTQQ